MICTPDYRDIKTKTLQMWQATFAGPDSRLKEGEVPEATAGQAAETGRRECAKNLLLVFGEGEGVVVVLLCPHSRQLILNLI